MEDEDEQQPDDEADVTLRAWKSNLVKDGLGPFLLPKNLRQRVQLETAKHGLTENYQPDALGVLMDLTEQYMKGFLNKVILKGRTRLQESQPNQLRHSQIGEQTRIRTTQYVVDRKKYF